MASEGMHAKCKESAREETVNVGAVNLVLLSQVVTQIHDFPDEVELPFVVCRIRGRLLADAVVHGDVRQIGKVAMQGHHKCHLGVFRRQFFIAEQVGIFLISLQENIPSVQ